MGIRLFTDSTGGYMRSEIDALQVTIIPLSVNWEGGTYVEGTRDTYAQFYDILPTLKELPTTSQPALGDVRAAFSQALEAGDEIIAITLCKHLSGTYETFCAAAAELAPDRISVIDSLSTVSNIKLLARMARTMIDEGKSRGQIAAALDAQAHRNAAVLFVDDLRFLKKGGRLSSASFLIGRFLNIYPVLILENDILLPYAKVKGRNRLYDKLIEPIPLDATAITVLHCDAETTANEIAALLRERHPTLTIVVEELTPVIGTHLGNGAAGVAYSW